MGTLRPCWKGFVRSQQRSACPSSCGTVDEDGIGDALLLRQTARPRACEQSCASAELARSRFHPWGNFVEISCIPILTWPFRLKLNPRFVRACLDPAPTEQDERKIGCAGYGMAEKATKPTGCVNVLGIDLDTGGFGLDHRGRSGSLQPLSG